MWKLNKGPIIFILICFGKGTLLHAQAPSLGWLANSLEELTSKIKSDQEGPNPSPITQQVESKEISKPIDELLQTNLVNKNQEIQLGSTMPLSKGMKLVGEFLNAGLNLVFNKLNQAGGIKGLLLRFTCLDDRNRSKYSQENIDTLLKKTPLLVGNWGAEVNDLCEPYQKQGKLFNLLPTYSPTTLEADANIAATSLYWRASLKSELTLLIHYAVNVVKQNKIALFYEDSLIGKEALNICEKLLKKIGKNLHCSVSYRRNTVSISDAANKIAVSPQPDAVICVASPRAGYYLLSKLVNKRLSNCLFMATSSMSTIRENLFKSRGIELILSSPVPNPAKSTLPLIEDYRKDMQLFLPKMPLSIHSLEGYIIASLLGKAIASLNQDAKKEANISLALLKEAILQLNKEGQGLLPLTLMQLLNSSPTLCPVVWLDLDANVEWPCFIPFI